MKQIRSLVFLISTLPFCFACGAYSEREDLETCSSNSPGCLVGTTHQKLDSGRGNRIAGSSLWSSSSDSEAITREQGLAWPEKGGSRSRNDVQSSKQKIRTPEITNDSKRSVNSGEGSRGQQLSKTAPVVSPSVLPQQANRDVTVTVTPPLTTSTVSPPVSGISPAAVLPLSDETYRADTSTLEQKSVVEDRQSVTSLAQENPAISHSYSAPQEKTAAIVGKMDINFGTRKTTPDDDVQISPEQIAQDRYVVSLIVAQSMAYEGSIVRKPRLMTKFLGREVQKASLEYNINVFALKQDDSSLKKLIAKWIGNVSIDQNGTYHFGSELLRSTPLQFVVKALNSYPGFKSAFSGMIIGKSDEAGGSISKKLQEYTRYVRGKPITAPAKKTDPLRFVDLSLAAGPLEVYPKTIVNGNLDFDYETGNWSTTGIRFQYTLNGKAYEDIMTGSIKWIEDPKRMQNGKGHYEFNLRFNEHRNRQADDESAFFSGGLDEEAFFAVDESLPGLSGSMAYKDVLSAVNSKAEPVITESKITYNLVAHHLSNQQITNFFKLWMLAVGPVNDE